MAGARIGFCIGEAGVIANFEKVRNHYGINRLAQAAALAAIGDQDYLQQTVARITAAKDRIGAIAKANGLSPIPSATNFVTLDCHRDGAFAQKVMSELLTRDIFVRMPGVAPLNRCVRIGAGLDEDLDVAGSPTLPEAHWRQQADLHYNQIEHIGISNISSYAFVQHARGSPVERPGKV